jgi:CubicO group peptidase (beta-lactamase class C family)
MLMENRFRKTLFPAILLLLGTAAAGCSKTPAPAPAESVPPPASSSAASAYWPTDGWRTSAPEEQGMDGRMITQVLDTIEREGLAFHSLLIVRNGYLVSESYFWGYSEKRKHDLYSVTKSFVSTLVGIAVDQGYIEGIERPMAGFFPGLAYENPDPRKESLTLEDVLTMRTGLDWKETDSTFNAMYRTPDWVKFMFDLPLADAPGSTFHYCSGCSHLLAAAVQKAADVPLRDFADQYLFQPLGITNLTWETGGDGIPIGGWGLAITPRDMAKLGYLFLRGGVWDGNQVVSAGWVKEAARRHTNTDNRMGYGYQWWIYPNLNAYAALGLYGQTVFVIPEKDLIIVTTAGMEGHDRIFQLIEAYLAPAAA